MVRTPSCDKNGLKKGTWTPAEDKKLKDYVDKHGCWNWRQLPKHAGLSRCGKSCRLRWMNYLRPNVKRGNFTHEEDKLILELHESLGNRWSAIATHLPGRTDNEIKNHWHSSLKNRATNFSSKPIVKKSFKRASNLELKTNEAFNIDSNNILESTPIPMCPQVPSSPLSSLANTVSSSTNFKKFGVEDDACSKQVIGESMGDFWTEPFLQDFDYNFSNTSDNFLRPLPELGILSPPCPIDEEDTFWFYCLHTEHIHGFQ